MCLEVVTLNIDKFWRTYETILGELNCDHPFYSSKFLKTFSDKLETNVLHVFVYKDCNDKSLIMMPILLRPTNQITLDTQTYYDVISPYGYSGPYYNKNLDVNILKSYWQSIDSWYQDNNVVSEFIRFDLNTNYSHYSGTLMKSLDVIKGKLIDIDLIWKNYEHKVRKNINKAKREQLEAKVYYKNISKKVFEEFYAIYIQTMDRKNANNMFYFSKEKLEKYMNDCEKNIAIAVVYKEEIAIAVEFILLSETTIFSFLGGTKAQYFSLRPNNLLKHCIIEWACANGFTFFVLGGGQKIDDGIYQYKKGFFKDDIVTFYTGRKIINSDVYFKLCDNGDSKIKDITEGFFPRYRETSISK